MYIIIKRIYVYTLYICRDRVFSTSGPKVGGCGGGVGRWPGGGNVNCHGNDGRPHKADE